MTETKHNTNTMNEQQNYNLCPTCGREVHPVLDDYGMYHVGCTYCGLRDGVSTFLEENLTEEMSDQFRKNWNQRVLKSYLNEEAREILHLTEGGFAIVTNQDGAIVHTADNMNDVMQYLELVGDDKSYGIYLHIDGTLQYIGSTFLVWLIKQEFEK